ncbi:Eco47II family restriction endonuclease [Corynebacterium glutamicum]|uniref:Eco47II family restriction endonuclease n=1 Tax=Corynebacterium glutamicum TaxID=1718 RepID=UPI003C7EB079
MGIYDLIDEQVLVDLAARSFRSVILKNIKASTEQITAEPTLAIARSLLTPSTVEQSLLADRLVNITKSLQNAVGNFHQEVLGAFDGWESTGSNGGSFDIRSRNPVSLAGNKKVLAEVKMRYNTIKASDEKNVFDNLRNAYIHNGRNDHISYLVQIVPKNRQPYNEPWKVSNRETDPNVRMIDGVSAYHLVSGHPTALRDLLEEFPNIFAKAYQQLSKAELDYSEFDPRISQAAILASLPDQSIFEP